MPSTYFHAVDRRGESSREKYCLTDDSRLTYSIGMHSLRDIRKDYSFKSISSDITSNTECLVGRVIEQVRRISCLR